MSGVSITVIRGLRDHVGQLGQITGVVVADLLFIEHCGNAEALADRGDVDNSGGRCHLISFAKEETELSSGREDFLYTPLIPRF